MAPRDQLPIEPLSENAWRRIEEATFQRLARGAHHQDARPVAESRRRAALIIAYAGIPLTAAAVLLLWWRQTAEPVGPRDLRLVAREQATESTIGDVFIHLEPHSALVVAEREGASSLVVLERGAAQFSVAPRERRPAFVVLAGNVRIEVVGTRFRVERQGDSACVETYEGVVRVLAAGSISFVGARERWPNVQRLTQVPNRASTEQVPTASTSADAVKPIHTPVSPSRTVQRAPQSTQATPNEKRRLLFEQAAVLEASDPQRALEIYQSLTTERGDWAANALYAMGRLEEERGNRVRALRLLQRYIEQYPYGANTADARLLIARMISRSVPQAGREGQP
jgi:hypothetical protein